MSSKPLKWLFDITGGIREFSVAGFISTCVQKCFFWPSYGERSIAPSPPVDRQLLNGGSHESNCVERVNLVLLTRLQSIAAPSRPRRAIALSAPSCLYRLNSVPTSRPSVRPPSVNRSVCVRRPTLSALIHDQNSPPASVKK